MGSQNTPPERPNEVPEDGAVIRQVQWAWLWSSMPWLIILFALTQFGVDPIVAAVVSIVVLVPRYLMWRRTEYILTKETLIYQRGGITGARKFHIPMSRLRDVRHRHGMFGRALGYEAVDVIMDNGAVASLTFIPAFSGVAEYLRELIGTADHASEEDQDAGGPSDEPRPYDPDVSRYDPDEPPEEEPPEEEPPSPDPDDEAPRE